MEKDFTSWVEVHLQTNQNLGDADLGWIPFEACPPMSVVEVSDETWGPLSVDRDLTGESIWMNGTLRFSDNQTAVEGCQCRDVSSQIKYDFVNSRNRGIF